MNETKLPDKQEWADRLERFRRAEGIIQTRLADEVGISHVTLIRVLKGNGTLEQLKKVEIALINIMLNGQDN